MGPNLSADLSRLHQRELLLEAEHERLATQARIASASSAAEPTPARRQHAMLAPAPRRMPQVTMTPA
jgi:hypothetical protein